MGISKINSLAAASLAKANTVVKASINKVSSVIASFAAAFTDTKAVSKSTTVGSGNAITVASTTHFNFVQSDAYSIGFWIKVGWDNNLNTNIHFFAANDGSSTARNQQIRIFYNESNNRLEFRIGSDSSNRSLNFWALHSNLSDNGLAGSAASQYWSSATTANRGNVNGDNFTHLSGSFGFGYSRDGSDWELQEKPIYNLSGNYRYSNSVALVGETWFLPDLNVDDNPFMFSVRFIGRRFAVDLGALVTINLINENTIPLPILNFTYHPR